MDKRYFRNIPALSPEEQLGLRSKKVLVLGCGGLGGYIIENLARMGVGRITAVDGDVFEASNLNRQLLCTEENLGAGKAKAAQLRVKAVNPQVECVAVEAFFNETNADTLVAGQDLVMDALDSISARLLLEDACERQGVPLVHGAIKAWNLQTAVVMPGSGLLHALYASAAESGGGASLPVTAQTCAALQCAEALKLLCGQPTNLEGKLLLVDLKHMEWDVLDL